MSRRKILQFIFRITARKFIVYHPLLRGKLMNPIRIVKDRERIGEHSIKLQVSFGTGDETWTKALKSVLRALKGLLLYATK
jgi:hypothetical protein